ncbi:MAG: hypothetical protein P4L51_06215 [Puia sp.]|nr:hypothetical protein [Puia sp.]
MDSFVLQCWFYFLLPLLHPFIRTLLENQERAYLSLDKTQCRAGDTLWYRSQVTDDLLPHSPSTVLYIDVFDTTGQLVVSQKSMLVSDRQHVPGSFGIGQIVLPDTLATQKLFIRPMTSYQYSRDSGTCLYYPVTVYNPGKYSTQRDYAAVLPPRDTVFGNEPGISLRSSVMKDSVTCLIRGNSLFTGWGRPLTLRIKGSSLPADSTRLVLTTDKPWIRIKMHLMNVRGYLLLNLLDSAKILKTDRIYLDPVQRDSIYCRLDTVSTQPNGINVWQITLADTLLCNVTVSVTDADKEPAPPFSLADALSIGSLPNQQEDSVLRIDSKYLEFEGRATTGKGKTLPVRELVGDLWRDPVRNMLMVLPLDGLGRFHLENLYFDETARLDLQRNNHKWNADDIQVTLFPRKVPPFHLPAWLQPDSVAGYRNDTSIIFSELPAAQRGPGGFFAPKEIKGIKIKVNKNQEWVKWRDELVQRYDPGDVPPMWVVDLVERPDTTAINVVQCLKDSIPGFGYSMLNPKPVPRLNGKRCVVFVDDVPINYTDLSMLTLSSVATIFVDLKSMRIVDPFAERQYYEDDTAEKLLYGDDKGIPPPHPKNPPPTPPIPQLMASNGPEIGGVPAIMIYTRHPDDWKYLPSRLRQIPLTGFASIKTFHPYGDNRWTLYWSPVERNRITIRFMNNNFTTRFRIHVEGIDALGRVIVFDRIVEKK